MPALVETFTNAQDFISYLNGTYGKTGRNPKTIGDALDAWETWENQGTSRPKDIIDTASDPFERYKAYFEDVINTCDLETLDSEQVHFALVHIKNLNAYASTLSNQDKVIVFDENLISFTTAFIIASMVSVYADIPESEREETEQFIIDTIKDFYIRQQTTEEKQHYRENFIKVIKKDYKLTEIGCYFSMAFTVFILCHELAHHILGHTTEKSLYAINTGTQSIDIPLNNPDHEDEFAADQHGYKLFLELVAKSDLVETAKLVPVFHRAPLLFFDIVEATEQFAPRYGYTEIPANSHPSPLARKQHLLDTYENRLSPESQQINDDLTDFIQYIKTLI